MWAASQASLHPTQHLDVSAVLSAPPPLGFSLHSRPEELQSGDGGGSLCSRTNASSPFFPGVPQYSHCLAYIAAFCLGLPC